MSLQMLKHLIRKMVHSNPSCQVLKKVKGYRIRRLLVVKEGTIDIKSLVIKLIWLLTKLLAMRLQTMGRLTQLRNLQKLGSQMTIKSKEITIFEKRSERPSIG